MSKKDKTATLETVEETTVSAPEKWVRYFKDNIFEDEDEVITIAESAAYTIHNRFGININDPILMTSIFLKIMESFIMKLSALEANYSEFTLNLAGRLAIGFTNNDNNEDDEKNGNYMIFMNHLRDGLKENDSIDPTISCQERTVQWNAENIIEQPELIRTLTMDAVKKLRDIDIELANNELIMPIFIVFYESIINYIKIRRREEDAFEKSINFSWFYIYCREVEDGKDAIYIRPTIGAKLALKNDQGASKEND